LEKFFGFKLTGAIGLCGPNSRTPSRAVNRKMSKRIYKADDDVDVTLWLVLF